ncbi:M3 family metallopeptidase [uncultured Shewanella sp.]|uniref:M3 family metallopeptidase n=1 Tax=uncultured Shewanella sp. TaxID=173975 RepID=UPI00260B9774|nr:M3 family metallopeptidase [uncultured Shewanella sp.]
MMFVGIRAMLLLISIGFSSMAFSATTPLSLLVKQCLQLPPLSTGLMSFPLDSAQDVDTLAERMTQLEHQLLSFYNIKDRVNYYKQFPIRNDDKESLLNCQFYLSDSLQHFVLSDGFTALLPQLLNASDNELAQLGQRLYRLLYNQQARETKSQLHTAQAAFKQGLASQALSLNFNDKRCQLPQSDNAALPDKIKSSSAFNQSIASYLLKQTDPNCRKTIWQAYQARTIERNTPILNTIVDIQNAYAKKKGFNDYASLQTSTQMLYSPELVNAFLDSQTHSINISPWNIGMALKKAKKSPFTALSSNDFLTQIYQALMPYGIRVEAITPHIHRVWLNGRLLGELFISSANQFAYQPIRHLVVGQQFGQIELKVKKTVSSYHAAQKIIQVVAMAINDFSQGSHYYFNNTLGETHDSANIGQYWLTYALTQSLIGKPLAGSRDAILQAYSKQLAVFRAKVALSTYQNNPQTKVNYLSQAFVNAFGDTWPQVNNYPVSFSAIADEGPLYYHSLWQSSLGQYLYHSFQSCYAPKTLFNALVTNEMGVKLTDRLSHLLNMPITPYGLIQKMQQNSPLACSRRRSTH